MCSSFVCYKETLKKPCQLLKLFWRLLQSRTETAAAVLCLSHDWSCLTQHLILVEYFKGTTRWCCVKIKTVAFQPESVLYISTVWFLHCCYIFWVIMPNNLFMYLLKCSWWQLSLCSFSYKFTIKPNTWIMWYYSVESILFWLSILI